MVGGIVLMRSKLFPLDLVSDLAKVRHSEIARMPWMRSHLSIFQEGFGFQKI